MTDGPRWDLLADAVKRRRTELRLRQADLAQWGGPGHVTVRKIENGEATSLRAGTKTSLERVLAFPPNLIDKILAGDATEEELSAHTVYVQGAPEDAAPHFVVDPVDTITRPLDRGSPSEPAKGWTPPEPAPENEAGYRILAMEYVNPELSGRVHSLYTDAWELAARTMTLHPSPARARVQEALLDLLQERARVQQAYFAMESEADERPDEQT